VDISDGEKMVNETIGGLYPALRAALRFHRDTGGRRMTFHKMPFLLALYLETRASDRHE
jgi:hypothetical protein